MAMYLTTCLLMQFVTMLILLANVYTLNTDPTAEREYLNQYNGHANLAHIYAKNKLISKHRSSINDNNNKHRSQVKENRHFKTQDIPPPHAPTQMKSTYESKSYNDRGFASRNENTRAHWRDEHSDTLKTKKRFEVSDLKGALKKDTKHPKTSDVNLSTTNKHNHHSKHKHTGAEHQTIKDASGNSKSNTVHHSKHNSVYTNQNKHTSLKKEHKHFNSSTDSNPDTKEKQTDLAQHKSIKPANNIKQFNHHNYDERVKSSTKHENHPNEKKIEEKTLTPHKNDFSEVVQSQVEGVFDDNSTTSSEMLEEKSFSSTNETIMVEPSAGSHSTCPHCVLREQAKENRKRALQIHILRMLRMEKPPNVTGVPIPKMPALAHLYNANSEMMADAPRVKSGRHRYGDDHDSPQVKTQRIFTTARNGPDGVSFNLTDTLYFSLNVQLYTAKIRRTYLWFFIRRPSSWTSSRSRRPIKLTISRILPESIASGRVITKPFYIQELPPSKALGWKRIDMKDVLRQWIRYPMSNVGLVVRADDGTEAGENLVVLPPSSEVDKGYEPWLDSKILETRFHGRHKRSTNGLVCNERSNERRCCKYPLQLTFANMGWDWIVSPMVVQADFCSGECHMTMQDETPRSWINQQIDIVNGGSCCAPTRLKPLSLLYFDDNNNILFQILQDLKVERCGCI